MRHFNGIEAEALSCQANGEKMNFIRWFICAIVEHDEAIRTYCTTIKLINEFFSFSSLNYLPFKAVRRSRWTGIIVAVAASVQLHAKHTIRQNIMYTYYQTFQVVKCNELTSIYSIARFIFSFVCESCACVCVCLCWCVSCHMLSAFISVSSREG